MALQLRTEATFAAPSDIPARAPMPDDAVGFVDFTSNLHMTAAQLEMSRASSLVFSRTSTPAAGYYYGRTDIEQAEATFWDRIEYDHAGTPLGLLVESRWTQQIAEALATDLTQGTATGAAVALSVPSADAWRRWWSVTPSGAGEASLALTTASHAANEYSYIHFDVRGTGIVQVGVKNADVTAYANINLATGETIASEAASPAQARRRPGGSWTILLRVRMVTAGAALPYVASVAAMDTSRLGPSGQPFEVRAPRVAKSTSADMPERSFYATGQRPQDALRAMPGMMDLTGDFTAAFRVRSSWFAPRTSAALALLSNGSTSGTEIRFGSSNTLLARQSAGNAVVATNEDVVWKPDSIFRVGLSRTGSRIDVCVNGGIMSFDTGGEVADAAPSLLQPWGSGAEGNSWSGHLQKAIWWAKGHNPADLIGLVDRWL